MGVAEQHDGTANRQPRRPAQIKADVQLGHANARLIAGNAKPFERKPPDLHLNGLFIKHRCSYQDCWKPVDASNRRRANQDGRLETTGVRQSFPAGYLVTAETSLAAFTHTFHVRAFASLGKPAESPHVKRVGNGDNGCLGIKASGPASELNPSPGRRVFVASPGQSQPNST